jgi:hypothetical protein
MIDSLEVEVLYATRHPTDPARSYPKRRATDAFPSGSAKEV